MKVAVKKLSSDAVLPSLGSAYAAGADLYSIEELTLAPGETKLVHTGLAMETSELNSPIPVHFSSLIPRMLMFTLAISCLTTSDLP